ncbi:MAG TPA: triose-phosphate isomerase [Methylomirabilota bacterium]|nr:triose-phosphate isomerase [Methylomirabilota bacterium]
MTTWVGTSWKMNKTLAEALAFADALAAFAPDCDPRIQPFVIPPFTAVREVKRALSASRVKVGAQTMHWADAGAWTGEISPSMLTDCGLDLVELGHSERRAHFGESDETVGLKVEAAVRHGLIPLVCIGETLAERDAGRADAVLEAQVLAALGRLSPEQTAALGRLSPDRAGAPVLLAYEPVWAIGDAGVPAGADYADDRQARIKAVAATILPAPPPVLYGGSVNPANAADLIRQPHIDGLFIGRSAWTAEGYIDILRRVAGVLGG